MKITRKHMEPLGFKSSSVFTNSNWPTTWYRVFPRKCVVIGLHCLIPRGVFKFTLTRKEMRAFQRGKLSLTPPGCCHPWDTPHKEDYEWIYQGDFKRIKELHAVLALTGLFPALKI